MTKGGQQKAMPRPRDPPWIEGMLRQLNAGFEARYGPSHFKEPKPTTGPKILSYYDLHVTKGWGPPYNRRGKRSNT